jgi:hypothetical protein
VIEVQPVVEGGKDVAIAARKGESPKTKRGGWLAQSVDLSDMSRCVHSLAWICDLLFCDAQLPAAFSSVWSVSSNNSCALAMMASCSKCELHEHDAVDVRQVFLTCVCRLLRRHPSMARQRSRLLRTPHAITRSQPPAANTNRCRVSVLLRVRRCSLPRRKQMHLEQSCTDH